jgi:hypothetical protein
MGIQLFLGYHDTPVQAGEAWYAANCVLRQGLPDKRLRLERRLRDCEPQGRPERRRASLATHKGMGGQQQRRQREEDATKAAAAAAAAAAAGVRCTELPDKTSAGDVVPPGYLPMPTQLELLALQQGRPPRMAEVEALVYAAHPSLALHPETRALFARMYSLEAKERASGKPTSLVVLNGGELSSHLVSVGSGTEKVVWDSRSVGDHQWGLAIRCDLPGGGQEEAGLEEQGGASLEEASQQGAAPLEKHTIAVGAFPASRPVPSPPLAASGARLPSDAPGCARRAPHAALLRSPPLP